MNPVRKHTVVPNKSLLSEILFTLVRYGKSQLLLVILITAISWAVLSLLGVRFALLLAVMTGALAVVPFFGMPLTTLIVSLVAIFDGTIFLQNVSPIFEGVVLFVVYGLLNIVIDYVLSPYLTGKITNIHPIILIISVIVATTLFGLLGAVFVVPGLLVVKTILDHYRKKGR